MFWLIKSAVVKAPVAEISKLKNTRKGMEIFFPRTYTRFVSKTWPTIESEINILLNQMDAPNGLGLTSDGLSLTSDGLALMQGHRRTRRGQRSTSPQMESSTWAGTKAFFGSVWDNTGGAVGRAYGNYRETVNRVYDGNIASTVVKAVGQTGVDAYSAYYDRKFEQTMNRIDTLKRGGMTAAQSRGYGVALAVGDITGITDLAEATGGYEVERARELDAWERAQKFATGTAAAAGTAAGVVGAVGKVNSVLKARAPGSAMGRKAVGSFCLAGNSTYIDPAPYIVDGQLQVPKPTYTVNPAHELGSSFNSAKSVLPSDAATAFKSAIGDKSRLVRSPSGGVQAETWWAPSTDGKDIYRYSVDHNGNAHYNGRFNDPGGKNLRWDDVDGVTRRDFKKEFGIKKPIKPTGC